MFSPFCPVDVRVTNAETALPALREELAPYCAVLLLASPGRRAALRLEAFADALRADGHTVLEYPAVTPNPTVEDVSTLLLHLRTNTFVPEAVVAVGGGSCIDLGKAAASLSRLLPALTPQAVREALSTRSYARPHERAALFALPTTAGTGSEVTRWATLWDPGNEKKLSLDDPTGFPDAAWIVPEWTCGMPAERTLSTGLDALSHAMEAYWAVAREPLSQTLALSAVAKIRDALPAALNNLDDPTARHELALGSLLAGLAFSRTRTTACHSISYPLTLRFGIPHGFAAALTLSSVLRRNRGAVPEMDRIEALFDESEGFDAWLNGTAEQVRPLCLSAFGVTESDLPAVCERASTPGRMDNNPVAFSPDDILEILKENL